MSPVNDSLRDGNSSDKAGLRISTAMVSKKETRSLTRNSQGDRYRPLRENQAEENIPDDFSFLFSIAKTQKYRITAILSLQNTNLLLWFLEILLRNLGFTRYHKKCYIKINMYKGKKKSPNHLSQNCYEGKMEAEKIPKSLLETIKGLLSCPTAPFREHHVREFIADYCKKRNVPFKIDDFGNLIIHPNRKDSKPLYFVAHTDHPGFILEKTYPDGTAEALFYGGWDPERFKAAPVTFFTSNGEVRAEAISWSKASKEHARRALLKMEGPAEIGNIGMWNFDTFRVEEDILFSRSCDDLIGCAIILDVIERLYKMPLPFGAVFTVAEEAGLHGAKYLCSHMTLPSRAIPISVETSRELPGARIGDGVVIRVGDSRSVFTPAITDFMVSTAKSLQLLDKNFRFQRKLMDAGQCEGTVFNQFGYSCGAISIPLGNYHNRNFKKNLTEAEYVSISDLIDATKLVMGMIIQSVTLPLVRNDVPKYKEETGDLGQRFLF